MTKPKAPTTPRTPTPRRRPDIPRPAPEDIQTSPAQPAVLDLAARAAARKKAAKVAPKVKVGTVTYDLPGDLKLDTLRGVFRLIAGDIEGLEVLMDDFFGHDATHPPEELTAAERAALTPAQKTERTKREKAYNPAFVELTLDDIGELFDYVTAQYGIDLGNSPASTTS